MKNVSELMENLSAEDVDVLLENCDIAKNEKVSKKTVKNIGEKVGAAIGAEIKPKRKRFSVKFRIGLVAAALCVAIIVTAIAAPWSSEMKPGRLGKLWRATKMISLDKENGTIIKTASLSGGRTLSLNINYLPVLDVIPSVVGSGAERDVCVDMIGYFLYSIGNFDFDTHFKLFEQKAVDFYFEDCGYYGLPKWVYNEKTGEQELKEGNWTYGEFIKELSKAPAKLNLKSSDCFFEVSEVYSYQTEEELKPFIDEYSDNDILSNIMQIDKIVEIRKYIISNVYFIFNGKTFFDLSNEYRNGFYFYRYDNTWYILPSLMDYGGPIDIIRNDYIEENTVWGYVTEIGDGYITVERVTGRRRCFDFYGETNGDIKVGDAIKIRGTGANGIGFYTIKSYEIVDESQLEK